MPSSFQYFKSAYLSSTFLFVDTYIQLSFILNMRVLLIALLAAISYAQTGETDNRENSEELATASPEESSPEKISAVTWYLVIVGVIIFLCAGRIFLYYSSNGDIGFCTHKEASELSETQKEDESEVTIDPTFEPYRLTYGNNNRVPERRTRRLQTPSEAKKQTSKVSDIHIRAPFGKKYDNDMWQHRPKSPNRGKLKSTASSPNLFFPPIPAERARGMHSKSLKRSHSSGISDMMHTMPKDDEYLSKSYTHGVMKKNPLFVAEKFSQESFLNSSSISSLWRQPSTDSILSVPPIPGKREPSFDSQMVELDSDVSFKRQPSIDSSIQEEGGSHKYYHEGCVTQMYQFTRPFDFREGQNMIMTFPDKSTESKKSVYE